MDPLPGQLLGYLAARNLDSLLQSSRATPDKGH